MRPRYEALVPIGTGGMATVFVGRDRSTGGRLVALKRAHPHVRKDEALAASMKREAWLASRLDHPNVVRVLDVEEDPDDLVLVLDYVEGCTLRTLLSKVHKVGEHRPRETLRIILDIAAGLHAAHHTTDEDGRHLGLVHRDVSPSNILVGADGMSRLADFGIAKAALESGDRTETGVLKGKSSYMAPEYVMHQHAHPASDLFSLAVTAWESLAGERLFRGATEIETLERVIRADARPLSEERPELASLDAAFRRALARIPEDRQPSVDVFARELEVRARPAGLVASHAEVRTLVERMIGPELAERRAALPSPRPSAQGPSVAVRVRPPAESEPPETATELFERELEPAPGGAAAAVLESATAIYERTDDPEPEPEPEPELELESETSIFDDNATDPTKPLPLPPPRTARPLSPVETIPGRPKRRRPRTRPQREGRVLLVAFLAFAVVLAAMAVHLWRRHL